MSSSLKKRFQDRTTEFYPQWALLILGIVFLVLVALHFNDFQIGAYRDDAHYIIIARALASGKGYTYSNFPATVDIPPAFPIGFPLALVPFIELFPNRLAPLRLVALSATLVNGLLLYRYWPRWTGSSRWWGVAIAGLYGLMPLGVTQARMVMSEPLFLTIYLLLIVAVTKYQSERGRWWHLPLILLLAVTLVALRSIGLAIVAGVGLSFASNIYTSQDVTSRQRAGRFILLGLGTIVFVVVLIAANVIPQRYWGEGNAKYIRAAVPGALASSDPEAVPLYISACPEPETPEETAPIEGEARWRHLSRKLQQHVYEGIPGAMVPISTILAGRLDRHLPGAVVQAVFGTMIFLIMLLGGLRWIGHAGRHVLWLSGITYVGALVFWNWEASRLLYPVVPHLVYAFLLGCEALLQLILQPTRWAADRSLIGFSLFIVVGALLFTSALINILWYPSTEHVGDLTRRTVWFRQHATPDQIVMTEHPWVDHIYAETQTVDWPEAETECQLYEYLRIHQVDYLLLAPEIEWDTTSYHPNWSYHLSQAAALLDGLVERSHLEKVYANETDNVIVYQVNELSMLRPSHER